MNLYVSNLGSRVTEESLGAVFAAHGIVGSSRIIKDHQTGSSKGFGFVEMPDDEEAEKAMKKINGAVLDGREVSVRKANPRPTAGKSFIERLRGY